MDNYTDIQKNLASGWNTFDTASMLSFVLMPSAIAFKLSFKSYAAKSYLRNVLAGRLEKNSEIFEPGIRTWDLTYTKGLIKWQGFEATIETAVVDDDDIVLLLTPLKNELKAVSLIIECGVLWGKAGYASSEGEKISFHSPHKNLNLYTTSQNLICEPYTECIGAYLAVSTESPIGISTGIKRSIEQIESILSAGRDKVASEYRNFDSCSEICSVIKSCLAWDTFYEPLNNRVLSSVSRIWNCQRGGYALYCWDSFFAGYMAAIDNEELAYTNCIEIINEKGSLDFIPNVSFATGRKSRDRSQPPVGSLISYMLYLRFGKKWFLEQIFDSLLVWNRWWDENRKNGKLLSWGSNAFNPVVGDLLEYEQPYTPAAAALESGLDNSPMYDGVAFNKQTSMMELNDVGLNSLYICDCKSLASIAEILGKETARQELNHRAQNFSKNLNEICWDENVGMFLNYRIDISTKCTRTSPTNFYPLLAKIATDEQARRIITEHLYDTEKFWGKWVIPSINRQDSAYKDQNYWRGRIWGPMNFLVYLGLRNYRHLDIASKAASELADKSVELLLAEWNDKRHIHENYNADTGQGCDSADSDRYYSWGGLLGVTKMIEMGHFPELDRMEDLYI